MSKRDLVYKQLCDDVRCVRYREINTVREVYSKSSFDTEQ